VYFNRGGRRCWQIHYFVDRETVCAASKSLLLGQKNRDSALLRFVSLSDFVHCQVLFLELVVAALFADSGWSCRAGGDSFIAHPTIRGLIDRTTTTRSVAISILTCRPLQNI
jgi:hypothetical protein